MIHFLTWRLTACEEQASELPAQAVALFAHEILNVLAFNGDHCDVVLLAKLDRGFRDCRGCLD